MAWPSECLVPPLFDLDWHRLGRFLARNKDPLAMSFPVVFFSALLIYLGILILIAWRLEKRALSQHPAVIILAIGSYAGLLGLHSSLDMAYEFGFGFLAYYLGAAGAFLLAPVLLLPIYRLTQRYQLFSLPDLLAFRFRSQISGTLSSLCALVALTLLLAVQFQLLSDSITLVSARESGWLDATAILSIIIALSLVLSRREEPGQASMLAPVLAVETVVRLALLLALAAFILWSQFGGPMGMDEWIRENGQRISAMERHLADDPWRALLLLFFAAPLIFPPLFYLLFSQKAPSNTLFKASWGVPLMFLLASLPIPVFIWGAIRLFTPTSPELYILGNAIQAGGIGSGLLALITLTCSALLFTVLSNLSVTAMTLNHLVLPWIRPAKHQDIYRWLKHSKLLFLVLIPVLSWQLHYFLPSSVSTTRLLILAFALVMQCFPGTLALVYWPQGNRLGFIAGLIGGCLAWGLLMGYPWLADSPPLWGTAWVERILGDSQEHWHLYLLSITLFNTLIFFATSLLTGSSPEEVAASRACSIDSLPEHEQLVLSVHSVEEIRQRLSKTLGSVATERELQRALSALGLEADETRPLALKHLRQQLEANLSGLLGPATARRLIGPALDQPNSNTPDAHPSRYLLENQLEDYHNRLSGLAAEVDSLRRYHRQILQQLPLPACTVSPQLEVEMWNQSMQDLTGIPDNDVLGSPLSLLPQPWAALLLEFASSGKEHVSKKVISVDFRNRWFNLNKARLEEAESLNGGWIILVEDCTETQTLEQELAHSERLASVGRLAAGVAHEIGNPITGIACLAQNLKLSNSEEEVLDTASQIHQQTERVSRILQTLMNFSRGRQHQVPGLREGVDLHDCAEEAIHLLSLDRDAPAVAFKNQIEPNIIVRGDNQHLSQVFVNLLSNARDACQEGDTIELLSRKQKHTVDVQVVDPGCGIPAENQDRLFEPFYTTKGPGTGTGLGLSLVYGIIEEHRGHIRVESPYQPTGIGTCVSFELPLDPDH